MEPIRWIEQNLHPLHCNSEAFFYDAMESQSYYSLPIIYQPFDPGERAHWHDRGALFDFLYSVNGEGKTLLDFGPGDGWPSLIVAPFAKEVIGVDGSRKRVAVCTQNAARLGITNARFIHVEPGCPLPFPDGSFDGVMASTSIEQTQDPRATLQELYRVLRPGGRMRIFYEGLRYYQGWMEQEVDLEPLGEAACKITLYDRDIEHEQAHMASLTLEMPVQAAMTVLAGGQAVDWNALTDENLEKVRQQVSDARICTLTHPSCTTHLRWMREIGFREAYPTHSGDVFASRLFAQIPEAERPKDLAGVDKLLRPLVKIVVQMAAPEATSAKAREPMITAVK